jgi:hypothetical protein
MNFGYVTVNGVNSNDLMYIFSQTAHPISETYSM